MKKLIFAAALAIGMATAPAMAAPVFSLGGYQGPIKIKFSNFENLTNGLSVDSQNYGIVNITSIADQIGNNLWANGGTSGYLTGVFNGITINDVSGSAPNVNATADGGHLDIYLNSSSVDAAQGTAGYGNGGCAIGGLCYHTITDAGGTLFLSLDFAPGADALGNTLVGTFTTATAPFSGTALGYLDVVGGAYASMFDTNGQTTAIGTLADLLLQNTFCPNGDPNCQAGGPAIGDWQLLSDDPVRGSVPEPGTTALLGLGLVGLFVGMRRRRSV